MFSVVVDVVVALVAVSQAKDIKNSAKRVGTSTYYVHGG